MENAPLPHHAIKRDVELPLPRFSPRGIYFMPSSFIMQLPETLGGEGAEILGQNLFRSRLFRFPITSLANNLIEEGAATHILTPSVWRAA